MNNTQTTEDLTVTEEILASDSSRKIFLAKLLGGAAAATALVSAPASVFASTGQFKHAGASIPASDAAILNFALTLEHLEARFYERASQAYPGVSYVSQMIRDIKRDEEAHVSGLTAAIHGAGYKPVAAAMHYLFPAVFSNRHAFLKFGALLEKTGVHAYLGQAGNIKTPSILLTAASIATVEARHTGAFNALLHNNPSEGPFDKGYTMNQVLAIAGPLIGK